MDSKEYWRKREAENLEVYLKEEKEYTRRLNEIYDRMLDNVQREINAFYGKYAAAEGISIAEAKKRVSELDIAEYERKAQKYVAERDFSKQANEEMRLYNLTMKVNRLEMLKANIGLECIAGHDELEKYMGEILEGRTMEELQRQAGILGKSIRNNAQLANAIVNASFHNAKFSDRIWMNQSLLKAELEKSLQTGLIQGRNARALARDIQKQFGVSKYNAERLMRTELARVQTEAQKQSFENNGFEEYEFITNSGCCDACQALDGKHFKVKSMMPGDNAPPIHPNCRCSVAAYEDDDEYEAWLDYLDKGGSTEEWEDHGKAEWGRTQLRNMALPESIAWPLKGKSISLEEYKDISEYARNSGVKLEGFKQFDGDINVIKQLIDDAKEITDRFPKLNARKNKITISLDMYMNSADFAITNGHIIRINADAFRNVNILQKEYNKLVEEGWFVSGTNYRSIIKHELGHAVENIYGFDGLEIAKKVTGINSTTKLITYLEDNLSRYSSEFEDGSEIISEVFADVFGSDNPSEFALKFIEECNRIK